MNIFSAILTAIEANFAGKATAFVATIPAFFVNSIIGFAEAEVKIFRDALTALLADIKAGKGWESAFTDMLNVFYSGEKNELNTVAVSFLEWIAKEAGSL